MLTFASKNYNEKTTLEFDFSNEIIVEDILTAELIIDVVNGYDPHPGLVLVGPPTISSQFVLQEVQGGVPETIYRLSCKITTSDGRIVVMPAYLPVSGLENPYSENYLTNP